MAFVHRRSYGIYRWLANMPRWFYRLGLGWLLGHCVMQLTHRGRKSGQLRRTILEVLHYDPQTREVLVVSGWEGKPDWYRNIEREPAQEVRLGRVHYRPVQELLTPEETAELILTLFRQRPGRSASSVGSWVLIPAPKMLSCMRDWKPFFGECVSAQHTSWSVAYARLACRSSHSSPRSHCCWKGQHHASPRGWRATRFPVRTLTRKKDTWD